MYSRITTYLLRPGRDANRHRTPVAAATLSSKSPRGNLISHFLAHAPCVMDVRYVVTDVISRPNEPLS